MVHGGSSGITIYGDILYFICLREGHLYCLAIKFYYLIQHWSICTPLLSTIDWPALACGPTAAQISTTKRQAVCVGLPRDPAIVTLAAVPCATATATAERVVGLRTGTVNVHISVLRSWRVS